MLHCSFQGNHFTTQSSEASVRWNDSPCNKQVGHPFYKTVIIHIKTNETICVKQRLEAWPLTGRLTSTV